MARSYGEGSIYQRKDGRFVASWVENERRRSAYAKSEKEAKAKLVEVAARIKAGQTGADSTVRFRDYATKWTAEVLPSARDRRGRLLSAGTRRLYGDVIELHAVDVLGKLQLNAITEADVERVFSKMEAKGLSGSYQKTAHKALARMFRDAKKARLLAVIPMQGVAAPAEQPKPKVVPTSDQVRELIAAAPNQQMRTFIAGLALTGLRISELLGAKWSDLDDEMLSLRVMGKGQRPRTIPVAPALKAELVKWRRVQAQERLRSAWWDEEGNWLLSSACGTRWEPHNARKRFRPVADRVLVGMTPHSLRHATATMLLEEKIPMKVVAELLGHSSTRVTEQTYSHVTARLVTETTDALERRLGGLAL